MKNMTSGWARSTALLSGLALALTACSGGDEPAEAPTTAPSTTASPTESASPSPSASEEASPSESETPSAEPTVSATPTEEVTSAAPSTDAAAEPAQAECQDLTADGALAAAQAQGLLTPGLDEMTLSYATKDGFDPCADLSAISIPLGPTGMSPVELQLFHRGEPLGAAIEEPYPFNPDKIVRLDEGALQVSFLYMKPEDASHADASGVATSTFTWDEAAGKVVRTGELPPSAEAPAADESTPSASDGTVGTGAGEVVGIDEQKIVFPSDAMAFDMGYCFAQPNEIACHTYDAATADRQEYVLKATGPATGPTPYDGPMGFEDPGLMDMIVDLKPGQTLDMGSVTCVASASDLACTSSTSGAGVTFTDGAAQVTPPTR